MPVLHLWVVCKQIWWYDHILEIEHKIVLTPKMAFKGGANMFHENNVKLNRIFFFFFCGVGGVPFYFLKENIICYFYKQKFHIILYFILIFNRKETNINILDKFVLLYPHSAHSIMDANVHYLQCSRKITGHQSIMKYFTFV